MKKRLIISVILAALWLIALSIYNAFAGGFEGATAVQQLEDDIVTYGWARLIANGAVRTWINILFGLPLACLWVWPIGRVVRESVVETAADARKKEAEKKREETTENAKS